MAHGAPDWFGTNTQGLVHRVADLAEMAVRLGSWDTNDRRGNVLYQDSFENGLAGWALGVLIGVADVFPVAAPVHGGALAITIKTDAVAGAATAFGRCIGLPIITKMGLEIAFCMPTDVQDVGLYLTVHTVARTWYFITHWRQDLGQLRVLNDVGAQQTVASPGVCYVAAPTFYVLKMVVDPVAGRYTRLLFNADEYDASAITPWNVAPVLAPVCQIGLTAASNVAVSKEVIFDDFILTMNE
jgi:hypothetical protein